MRAHQRTEYRILHFLLGSGLLNWRPTTLPALANQVGTDWNTVIAAVDRLYGQGIIELRKWMDGRGFVPYRGFGFDAEFFHRGDFQLRVTPMGEPYYEALHRQAQLENPILGGALRHAEELERLEKTLGPIRSQLAEFSKLTATFPAGWNEAFGAAKLMRENLALKDLWRSAAGLNTPLVEDMQKALKVQLEPLMGLYKNMGLDIAEKLGEQNQFFGKSILSREMERAFAPLFEQSKAIQAATAGLPGIALSWPSDVLARRLGLVENAVKNAGVFHDMRDRLLRDTVLEDIRPRLLEKLDIAGQFVYDHNRFVRRLPPPLPLSKGDGYEDEREHRDEEVGAKLEAELAKLDPRLAVLRRRAWENLKKGDVSAARLAAAGARELYTEILHLLSPDDELQESDIWQKRSDASLAKPTRRMRIEFIVGAEASELDVLAQFDQSIAQANKFTHKFADNVEVVRVAMSQLENCAYLLLACRKPKGS